MPHKVSELNNLYPHDCEVLQQVRREYADWNWRINNGYIRYWRSVSNNMQRIYEHQLVARAKYNEAPNKLQAHHVNETKTDNRAANIELLHHSRHVHHHKGYKEYIWVQCPVCNKLFEAYKKEVDKNNNSYCSRECQGASTRKVERPSKQELETLLVEIGTWVGVGEHFGLSDNAIRKWAKDYGIPLDICNGLYRHIYKPMHQKTSAFKGVYKRPNRKRWYAQIYLDGKMKPLGTFDTEEEAARVYDAAALQHFGPDAYLNFA